MRKQFRLDGKRIAVTGASSGIGRQIAIDASRAGAVVIISGRNHERLVETREMLEPHTEHAVVRADLAQPEELGDFVNRVGVIDGIVHGAGIAGPAPIRVVSREFLQSRFETNFFAPVLLTQKLLAGNRISPDGSIVFIASIAAHTGTPGMSVYSASKASLVVTAKCLALEVAKRGIRVNALSPAVVRTPIFKPKEQEWLDETEKRYPLGLGTPADVANASVFFLSDASRWITGQTLIMDGACPWI